MVEYYTGQDASLMTEGKLAMKIAHINRIRSLEAEKNLTETINNLIGGKQ